MYSLWLLSDFNFSCQCSGSSVASLTLLTAIQYHYWKRHLSSESESCFFSPFEEIWHRKHTDNTHVPCICLEMPGLLSLFFQNNQGNPWTYCSSGKRLRQLEFPQMSSAECRPTDLHSSAPYGRITWMERSTTLSLL